MVSEMTPEQDGERALAYLLSMSIKQNKVLDLLKEIARGEGAFSRDPMKHAENTIENMKSLANQAIEVLERQD